ncbi:CpaE family protein [Phenylobacterium sp.]|uniref:AAA family ATPase n=1 Tax=Phenylobacterium sp. TaxID=1871053 RepID=UPI0035B406C7
MTDLPRKFESAATDVERARGPTPGRTVGVVEGAIGGDERFASLAALFPNVEFKSVSAAWPQRLPALDVLIVAASAASSGQIETLVERLRLSSRSLQIVVALQDADVMTTRLLVREGAADVLPAPLSEAALALCLERLLSGPAPVERRRSGEVVAFLKAGGGVGATSLAVQAAAQLAGRTAGQVCVADLDVQFGAAALYLDLQDAVTVADCLSAGPGLAETPFATALATHRSGARLLAAPRELLPLETLDPAQADALISGLRRDFALTLVDLPSVWTAWTNQVLSQADRIVLVTTLTVPHVQLVKRQLSILASQQLDGKPLILACNGLSGEQTATLPVKTAERALGRAFDVVLPEDRRAMLGAINEGLELSQVRRGTKLEKAIGELADRLAATSAAPAAAPASALRLWR